MPGSTPTYGFPVPLSTDPPDGPAQMLALAAAVEAEVARLDVPPLSDTGLLTNMGITPATGWTVSDKAHRIIGKMLFARVQFTRSGATLTANSDGNYADTAMGTIDAASLWPQFFVIEVCKFSATAGTVQLSPNTGTFTLVDGHPTGQIASGSNGQISLAYTVV